MAPFPPYRRRDGYDGDREKSHYKMTFQPVVALATVQHHFEAGKADRDQADSEIVNPELAAAPRAFRSSVNSTGS